MNNVNIKLDELPLVRNIDYCVSTRPFIHPNRILDYHVMIYLIKGQMEIWEDNAQFIIKPGDVFFLKSGLHHWGVEKIESDTEWYYIHFYQSNCLQGYSLYEKFSAYIKKQEFSPDDYKYFITLPKIVTVKNSLSAEKSLRNLLNLYNSSHNLRATYLSAAFMDFLLDFFEQYGGLSSQTKTEAITQKIILYLEANSSSNLNTNNLSEEIGLSYKYLCSLFKQQTAMSIHEYHTNIRMNEAARLLRETGMNVSEVCYCVGYKDPFYFSNVFKKIKGKSPSKY